MHCPPHGPCCTSPFSNPHAALLLIAQSPRRRSAVTWAEIIDQVLHKDYAIGYLLLLSLRQSTLVVSTLFAALGISGSRTLERTAGRAQVGQVRSAPGAGMLVTIASESHLLQLWLAGWQCARRLATLELCIPITGLFVF